MTLWKIIAGIIAALFGLSIGAVLWLMAIQHASMAFGPSAGSYAWSSKLLYWCGALSGAGGVVVGGLLLRSAHRDESGEDS